MVRFGFFVVMVDPCSGVAAGVEGGPFELLRDLRVAVCKDRRANSCPIGNHIGLRDLSVRTKVAGARLGGVGGFAHRVSHRGGPLFYRDDDVGRSCAFTFERRAQSIDSGDDPPDGVGGQRVD